MTIVVDTQPPPAPLVTGISTVTVPSTTGGTATTADQTISGTAQAGTRSPSCSMGAARRHDGREQRRLDVLQPHDDPPQRELYHHRAGHGHRGECQPDVSASFNTTIETVNSPVIAGVSLVTTSTPARPLGLGNQQSLSIVGTAPPNDSVQVYLGGTLLGSATANGQGNWSFSYVPSSSTVPAGTYGFSAVAIGLSGGTSARPTPTFQLQVGGSQTASTPQYASGVLSGQATPGSLVTIVDGDVVLGVVVAGASGDLAVHAHAHRRGKHSIMAEATNSAGITSLLSRRT